MKSLIMLFTSISLLVPAFAGAANYYPIIKCDGLTMDVSGGYPARKQLVINNVNNSFEVIGRMLNPYGERSPFFVKKWDSNELIITEYRVKWNSEFVTQTRDRLLTADMEGDRVHVRVYDADLLNVDDGVVNPSSINYKGEFIFTGCHRF
jgi:hypothetical protein